MSSLVLNEDARSNASNSAATTTTPSWRHLWAANTDIVDRKENHAVTLPEKVEIYSPSSLAEVSGYIDEVISFLDQNYIEDPDGDIRFSYEAKHIHWFIHDMPNNLDLLVSLRIKDTKQIVGFVTAAVCTVVHEGKELPSAVIDFMCVHKAHRGRRM